MLLFGLLLALLVAPAMAGAQGAAEEGPSEVAPPDVADELLVPDLVLQLVPPADGDEAAAERRSLIAGLTALGPVAWAIDDGTAAPGPNLLVGLVADGQQAGLRAVTSFVGDHEAADRITVGGRAADDIALRARIGRVLVTVTLMVAVAVGGLVAWLVRPVHGVVVGSALVAVGLVASAVGSDGNSAFDGSIITTSTVAVLAGLLAAVFVALRLVDWFADPEGDDLAEMIRRAIADFGTELLLLGAVLVVVATFLQIVGPGRSVATPAFFGVLAAVLLTLALVAPSLAALHGSGRPAQPAVVDERRDAVRTVFGSRPNGRQFPVAVILAFGFVFGFLSLVAISSRTQPSLVDGSDLGGSEAEAFDEGLRAGGGDPTVGVLARFPAGSDQLAKTSWLQRVSRLPNVGRVDTSVNRAVGGEIREAENSFLSPLSTVVDGDEAPTHALVVPVQPGRSAASVDLVEAIRAVGGPIDAELSGVPVDARRAGERDRSVVWVTILAFTLAAGVAVFGLTGDWNLAGIVAGLRLLDAMALVGLYHLVVGAVAGPELLVVVVLISIGASLFELGIVRRLLRQRSSPDDDPLTTALDAEGWAAAVAMAAVAFGALGFVGAGVGNLARHGVLLAFVLVIEVVVGLWLLRPAVLGALAVDAAAGRTVREALRALTGVGADEGEHARLAEAVEQLLLTEFQFQADPGVANMEEVFVGNTPLFRSAVDHHRNLAEAGLRITGRSPQLRDLHVVATEPTATVNVTVDHPVRQLIDQGGKVVGVRKPERRTMMLWLEEGPSGFRVADSVELGAQALSTEPDPGPAPSAMTLSMEQTAG
ncbi:MAG: hypothetical protein AAFN30_01300 [Actinomycetota bacterium]